MRTPFTLILLTISLLPSTASAASNNVLTTFDSPALAEGDLVIHASWIILEFQANHPISQFTTSTNSTVAASYGNFTWLSNEGQLGNPEYPVSSMEESRQFWLGSAIATWSGIGYIGIQAPDIEIKTNQSPAQVQTLAPDDIPTLRSGAPGTEHSFSFWAAESTSQQVMGTIGDNEQLRISVQGPFQMEMLGADVVCDSAACLTGGSESAQHFGSAAIESRSFERVAGLRSGAFLVANPARARFGGTEIDLEVSGAMRMPRTELTQSCECELDGEATLSLQGEFFLSEISPTPKGRLSATITGENVMAFSDESLITIPQFAKGAALAIGLAATAITAKLLLGLFTRLSKHEALEHPKRQKIFHYIQEHPGANFREVARNTDIAAGTVRHHLTVLERAGHVVEHPHLGTVRLFENHGKFDHNWSDVVLLREPPLAKLHDWLKQNPNSPQKAALEAMEREGWSRSTTQHRLLRLVEGGVATIRLQGRLKIYNVIDRQAPKPAFQHMVSLRPALAS